MEGECGAAAQPYADQHDVAELVLVLPGLDSTIKSCILDRLKRQVSDKGTESQKEQKKVPQEYNAYRE